MKKILSLLALSLCVVLGACSDDDDILTLDTIRIISAETFVDATGGTGTIVVESPSAIRATCEQDWCLVTVSGMTVSWVADATDQLTSRTAKITIHAADGSTKQVPISQQGTIVSVENDNINVPIQGGEVTVAVNATTDFTVSSGSSWLTASKNGDTITVSVEANTPLADRTGVIYLDWISGPQTSINIHQIGLLGNWDISYEDENGVSQVDPATAVYYSGLIRFYLSDWGMYWYANYDPDDMSIALLFPYYTGATSSGYYIWTVIHSSEGYRYTGSAYLEAPLDSINDNQTLVYSFQPTIIQNIPFDGIGLMASTSSTSLATVGTYSNRFYNLNFTRSM